MTFVRLSHRGAFYEPRTLALLIQRRLFAEGAGGLARETGPDGDTWRLTEWGELTVIEIIRIATTMAWSREDRGAAILMLLDTPRTYDALITGAHA